MLTLHQLEITIEATTPLALDIYYGSAVRGAFFQAFLRRFCSNREAPTCYECPLNAACPVAALVAPLRDESPRGRDVPRPYIITPSTTEKERYDLGETCTFGFTLLGSAAKFYPYVMRALLEMEHHALGHPLKELGWKRGRFRLRKIDEVHPFTGQRVCLWQQGERYPEKLQLGVTDADVAARASTLSPDSLTLHFVSPIRLVAGGHVLRQPDFQVLALRMAERLEGIRQEYGRTDGNQQAAGREWYLSIKKQAEKVHLEKDATSWVDVHSYSRRQQQKISIGGLVGHASFVGPLVNLHELLIWGELLRVGKNIVKGAGLYRIES